MSLNVLRAKMHTKTVMMAGVFACLAMMLGFTFLTGCSSEPVAATVDGENILEKDITQAVEKYRESNELTDDEAWAEYLVSMDMTPEQWREDTINEQVEALIIKKEAKDKGIEVTDQEVEKDWEDAKASFLGSGNTEEDLAEFLKGYGYTEDTYKDYIREYLLQEKLTKAIAPEANITDKDVVKAVNEAFATYDQGVKDVRYIVFTKDNEAAAKEALAAIKAGTDFSEVQSKYSTTKEYDGWDFQSGPSDPEVFEAIEELSKGEVSEIVKGENELFIIQVVDQTPTSFKNVKSMPTALYEVFVEELTSQQASDYFTEYLSGLVENAKVEITPIPEGLSYVVDLTAAQESAASNSDDSDDEGDDEGVELVEVDDVDEEQ